MKTLCIYHGNCADGFGAAWAVRKALGDRVEFYPGIYGQAAPDVKDRDVVLVDFSYKRVVLDDMARFAHTLLVLDHHKSAAEDLAHMPAARKTWDEHLGFAGAPGCPHTGAVFDMTRSGAMIAWNYFHPFDPAPRLIRHIQDRDLWKFELEGTREIQSAIFSYPYDFGAWDELFARNPDRLREEGVGIERKHHKDVAELVKICQRPMKIAGHVVPSASLPYTYSSDAGHVMAKGEPFAACYWDTPAGRVFSLRSSDDGMDVSEIAKQYGGGGHMRAAGFTIPLSRIPEFEP